jgi:hypothetical protein
MDGSSQRPHVSRVRCETDRLAAFRFVPEEQTLGNPGFRGSIVSLDSDVWDQRHP